MSQLSSRFSLFPVRAAGPGSTLLALLLALSGCTAVTPPSQLPGVLARHDSRLSGAEAHAANAAPSSARARWWRVLRDRQLDALMEQALARNLELKAALATVQEARAMAGLAQRDGGPQGGLGVTAQVSRPSLPEVDPYGQGLPRPPQQRLIGVQQSLSWEIDLFGRVATAQAAAERELDIAQADLQAAQALLQAELVNRYVQLRLEQQLEPLSAQLLALAEARVEQLQARVSAGLADARDLRAAEAERALRLAEQAGLQAQRERSLLAIALLCGHAPGALQADLQDLRAQQALPALPLEQSLQVNGDWLQGLPQVRRADAALRATLGQQVLAERAHLPRLSLVASVGVQEQRSRLGQSGALRYAAGPSLQWDWLDAGRRQAREAAAHAGSERAWAQLEQAVLQALSEAEGALQGWRSQLQAWEQAQAAEQAATELERYARERRAAGLEPPLQGLNSSAQWAEARQRSLRQQGQALQALVQVQLALGRWQPDAGEH